MREGADQLAQLTEAIRRIEGRRCAGGYHASGEAQAADPEPLAPSESAGAWPPPAALARGRVHEWLAQGSQPRERAEAWTAHRVPPPLGVLIDLAGRMVTDGQWAVWIGRWCWPHGPFLAGGEERASGSIERSLLVEPPDCDTRLWAMELAARHPAVSVVVGDGRGLSMTATRRLQLAAEAGHALVLLARSPAEHRALSAAAMRWQVTPVPAPGERPRWRIELVRCKGMQREDGTEADRTWIVEWDCAQGRVVVPADVGDRARPAPASHPSPLTRASA